MPRIALLVFASCLTSAIATAAPPDSSSGEWPEDPNPTRLIIGPTARSLDRGKVYIDSFGISVPFVQIGITDRISIGAGTPLIIPGVTPGEVFWLTPKAQIFRGDRTQASVGLLHIQVHGDASGIAYGVMTRGTADGAVTLGLGRTYHAGDHTGAALVLVGGEKRVSPRVKLLTENYLSAGGGLVNGGIRLIRRNASVDLALGATFAGTEVFPVPVIRIAYTF